MHGCLIICTCTCTCMYLEEVHQNEGPVEEAFKLYSQGFVFTTLTLNK